MLLIIVHRLLQSLVLPPLNAMLFIALGVILNSLNIRKIFSNGIIILGIILLYLQCTPFFAYTITKWIEVPPINEAEIKDAGAIVVLGGGVKNTGYEYPSDIVSNSSTLVRLRYTAFLAKQYPDKLIITSGGYVGPNTDAKIMHDTLINTFNVTNQILMENKSRTTEENAEFVAAMLRPLNIKNVIIVTQAYHARRATALFKKYGLNVVAAPTDFYGNTDAKTPQLAFIPSANAMQETAIILHEILGYFIYINLDY